MILHQRMAWLAVLLLSAVGLAEARAQLKAEPVALDLGLRQQEQTVTAEVILTNANAAALTITGVTADCGCTSAVPEKSTLAPGESTKLKITVETRAYEGAMHRTLHVQTLTEELTIPIGLTVSPFKSWVLEPVIVLIPASQKGRPTESTATLRYLGADKARLGKITSTPDWLEITAEVMEAGKLFRLRFAKRVAAPAGNHTVRVVVETSDPDEPRLGFSLFLPVFSELRVVPNPVILPTVKVGQSTLREVTLLGWNGEGEPRFELTRGAVKTLEREGEKVRCELSITPVAPGPLTQLLRVYDGDKLQLEVPVLLRAEPLDKAR